MCLTQLEGGISFVTVKSKNHFTIQYYNEYFIHTTQVHSVAYKIKNEGNREHSGTQPCINGCLLSSCQFTSGHDPTDMSSLCLHPVLFFQLWLCTCAYERCITVGLISLITTAVFLGLLTSFVFTGSLNLHLCWSVTVWHTAQGLAGSMFCIYSALVNLAVFTQQW